MSILSLKSLSHKHVVLGLLNNRFVPAIFLTDANGSGDALGWPLRGTPVESLALLDNVVERCASFFQRSLVVRSVTEDHIHVFELKSRQRVVKSLDDVLP